MKTIVCSVLINEERAEENRYDLRTKLLIESTLKFTNFDILIVTDIPDRFNYNNDRVIIKDFHKEFPDEPKRVDNLFNYNVKRLPIKICSNLDYDYVFYNDCDCFFSDWDEDSFKQMIDEGYDVYYATFYPHHTVNDQLSKPESHPKTKERIDKVKDIITDDMLDAVLAVETRMLYKNSDKLKVMIDTWDLLAKRCVETDNRVNPESTWFCMAHQKAKMKATGVNRNIKLATMCNMFHGLVVEKETHDKPIRVLNYFGHTLYRVKIEKDVFNKLGINY